MKLPCKEKYVDEAVPDWCARKNINGTWDVVVDFTHDVFFSMSQDQAETIANIQQEFKQQLYKYMCNFAEKKP